MRSRFCWSSWRLVMPRNRQNASAPSSSGHANSEVAPAAASSGRPTDATRRAMPRRRWPGSVVTS